MIWILIVAAVLAAILLFAYWIGEATMMDDDE